MKRQIVMVAVIGIIPLLAACGPATPLITAEPTDTPEAIVASPTTPATDTPAAISEEATEPEPVAAFPTPHPNPECVVEPIPEDPNIPLATADEWSKGPDDAAVTLVEYGDFQ